MGFSIRHLMVATVHGQFLEFEGTLVSDAHGLTSATGVVQAASIDTNEPKRDERLRGSSFLDVENSPRIDFESREIAPATGERFHVIGDLTIKEVTRPLVLETVLLDAAADPDRLHVAARGQLMRSEFGLSWSEVLDAAGAVISDRVDISLDVVAVPLRSR